MSDRGELTYSDFFGAAREGLKLGPDRHPKWQPVEPGTPVEAGRTYRVEYPSPLDGWKKAVESQAPPEGYTIPSHGAWLTYEWFVDSSWKPPLVLPTEPTWGIAVCPKPKGMDSVHDEPFAMVGRWARYDSDPDILTRTHRDFQTGFDTLDVSFLLDFIEFTPEQIARLEQNL